MAEQSQQNSDVSGETSSGPSALRRLWRRFGYQFMIVVVLAVIGGGFVSGLGNAQQVADLTQGYDMDRASIAGKGLANSSRFDGFTLYATKDGVKHTCMHVDFEDLRQGKPITCEDGTVFHKK